MTTLMFSKRCVCFFLVLQVRALAAGFGPTLQAHLSLALQDLQVDNKQSRCGSEEPPASRRSTEHSSIQKPITDLFQVLLQSLEEAAPCRFLLQEALVHRSPTLAVMAACQQVTVAAVKSTT